MKLLHDTHFKVKEAEYFYQKMKKAEREGKVEYFIYNFSAFLSAWRSICCCKEKESEEKKCEKFADFVSNEIDRKLEKQGISKNEIKIMKEKILKKAYNNLTRKEKEVEKKLTDWRNQIVHREYPPLNYYITLSAEKILVKDEWEIEAPHRLPNSDSPPDNTNKFSSDYLLEVFSLEKEREKVLDLCEKGLNMAKKFIENCEEILKSELSR